MFVSGRLGRVSCYFVVGGRRRARSGPKCEPRAPVSAGEKNGIPILGAPKVCRLRAPKIEDAAQRAPQGRGGDRPAPEETIKCPLAWRNNNSDARLPVGALLSLRPSRRSLITLGAPSLAGPNRSGAGHWIGPARLASKRAACAKWPSAWARLAGGGRNWAAPFRRPPSGEQVRSATCGTRPSRAALGQAGALIDDNRQRLRPFL